MENKNINNLTVTKDFLIATRDIIAQNTSLNYSNLALNGIKNQLAGEFNFLKNIHFKGKSIEVDKIINSVSKEKLSKFFSRTIALMGPNYLKMLLTQRLNQKDLIYLENIGIRFG